jgi:hypothetical protein
MRAGWSCSWRHVIRTTRQPAAWSTRSDARFNKLPARYDAVVAARERGNTSIRVQLFMYAMVKCSRVHRRRTVADQM